MRLIILDDKVSGFDYFYVACSGFIMNEGNFKGGSVCLQILQKISFLYFKMELYDYNPYSIDVIEGIQFPNFLFQKKCVIRARLL